MKKINKLAIFSLLFITLLPIYSYATLIRSTVSNCQQSSIYFNLNNPLKMNFITSVTENKGVTINPTFPTYIAQGGTSPTYQSNYKNPNANQLIVTIKENVGHDVIPACIMVLNCNCGGGICEQDIQTSSFQYAYCDIPSGDGTAANPYPITFYKGTIQPKI